ncbi:heme oxygenase-like protein [Hypoxylon sp. FL0890]|nr:heme oxygenase-like protein [Hypoxylon sp. FL0890]
MPSKTEDAMASPDISLGESINIATRPLHTKLNNLIIQRLRLVLPPQAKDASNYFKGLLHIAPIYITFESLWRTILDSSETEDGLIRDLEEDCPEPSDAHFRYILADCISRPVTSTRIHATTRIHAILSNLHIEGLSRSEALKQDLLSLTGWSPSELTKQLDQRAGESPMLSMVLAHIKRSVTANPHVLLAYAWVLYMALFSGGRIIRASLERVDPGSSFWTPLDPDSGPELKIPGGYPSSSEIRRQVRRMSMAEEQPLSFFRFGTPSNGEDLKQMFKARILALMRRGVGKECFRIKPEEHDDIVQEARQIFELMIGIVEELDEVCRTEYEEAVAK